MNKNNKYNVYCYICDKLMNYNYSFKHRRSKKHLKILDDDNKIISDKIYKDYKNYDKGQKKLLRELTKDKEEEYKQQYKQQREEHYNYLFT